MHSSVEDYYLGLALIVRRYRELRLRLAVRNADSFLTEHNSPDRRENSAARAGAGSSTTSWEVEADGVRHLLTEFENLDPPGKASALHTRLRLAFAEHAARLDRAASDMRSSSGTKEPDVTKWLPLDAEVKDSRERLRIALSETRESADEFGLGHIFKWPPEDEDASLLRDP